MKPKFKPTEKQIHAAAKVFVCMAWHDTVKSLMTKLEQKILNEGQFHYEQKWWKVDRELPADNIIRNPSHIYMMQGIQAYGTPAYKNSDAELFYNLLSIEAAYKGLIEKENADCIAHNDLIKAQNEFIEATLPIHHITVEMVSSSLDNRKQLIDLTLNLFAHLVKPIQNNVRDSYMNSKLKTND